MKLGRQRQAEHTERLKQLGLRQVAVWVSDTESWMISQASVGVKADRLDKTGDYMASLVDSSRQARVDSFLAVPGKMAVFEIEKVGHRKAIGVKVLAYRTTPVLIMQPLTADTTLAEVEAGHPQLKAALRLKAYGWDTPGFRAVCEDLELDPDHGRPRFRVPYEELGEELMRLVSEDDEARQRWSSSDEVLFDVLDLMRADLRPTPSRLDEVRRNWTNVDQTKLPQAEELARLIVTDELLRISHEQHLVNDAAQMEFAAVDFLPSRHGGGYSASVYGFYGEYDVDGWVADDYADLRGIAEEPAPEYLASSSWLRVVRRRLGERGVIFIPREKVGDYMEAEGRYWIDRAGGSAKWRELRAPSWTERLMWRVQPPPLLVDRELALRELARRG